MLFRSAFGEVPEGNGGACIIIEEIHLIAFPALPDQLISRIGIVVPCTVVGFAGTQAARLVLPTPMDFAVPQQPVPCEPNKLGH